MKKHVLFAKTLMLMLLTGTLTLGSWSSANAQLSYNFDFDANATGWTGDFGRFTGATACGGSGGAMRYNLYEFDPAAVMVSPLIGTSNGGMVTISYDYKVMNWSANTTATATPWGSFDVQYGPTASGPWTTIATVSDEAQTSGVCLNKSHMAIVPAGNTYFRWSATWASVTADYYLNFDNIVVSQGAVADCSGTPTAANALSSAASVCVDESFTLSLDEVYALAGITYQWQSSPDNSAWSNILGATASTLNTTQTSETYYRCLVECTLTSDVMTSGSVLVAQNAPTGCYCTPSYIDGTDFGDLISAVSISGTTLSNDVGFTAGQPSYLDFYNSVLPNQTGAMDAGSSYTVTISTGEWGSQGIAAWIDFNNNGIFEASEKIGNSATVIGSGFTAGQVNATANFVVSLPCDPTPGDYRMRVRGVYFTNGPLIDPCATYFYGQTHDYKVTVNPPPPCPSVTGLTAGTPGSFNVLLNWNQGCAETAWNVEYGATGFTPGTGTTVPAATNVDFDLTGLMSSTTYDIYVSADCGVDGTSAPFGPVTITTDVAPCSGAPAASNTESSVATACLGQDFTLSLSESYLDLGIEYQWQSSPDNSAWSDIVGETGPTYTGNQVDDTYYRCVITCTTGPDVTNSTAFFLEMGDPTDCYCVPAYSSGTSAGDLISAVSISGTTLSNDVGFTAGQPSYLDFYNSVLPNQTGAMNAGSSYTVTISTGEWGSQGVAAWIDFNSNGVFEASEKIGTSATTIGTGFTPGMVNATASFVVSLPCNPTPGDYRMRVRGVFATNGPVIDPCALYTWGQTHDYKVTVNSPPPCPSITGLAAGTPGSFNVLLNWNQGCAETAWNVEYGATGFTPGTGTTVPAGTNVDFDLTGLLANTDYDIYVSADCGVDGTSAPFGPVTITTDLAPCSGAPAASVTQSSVMSACIGQPFTLNLDVDYSGELQISYQWQSSPDGMTYSDIVGETGPTYTGTQTTGTWYQCVITCDATMDATTSTAIEVPMGNPTDCYCIPTYTFGKTAGDLISNVEIPGTTLANNSGTAQVNPAYTYFNSLPNHTGDLMVGSTYDVTVSIGTWGDQGVRAWIDYNDDGVFDVSESIGTSTIAPGGGFNAGGFPPAIFPITLSTSAPLGTHRMRIRCSWITDPSTIDPCANYTYGEAEDYDVTIIPAPPGTTLNATFCGATNVAMNQLVNAIAVPGALQYRFRITGTNSQGWPSDQYVYTSNSKNFRFQFIPGAMWGETYGVEVAYSEVPGVFGPYGASCDVTLQSLASLPLSSVNAAVCDATVEMNANINTPWVPGALGYRYQIVGNNSAMWPSNTVVVERPVSPRQFRFIDIPGSMFGETYAVSVAFQDGSGNWSAYGTPCNITIVSGITQLDLASCGATNVLPGDFLLADNVIGAAGYRFRITGANSAGWPMDQIEVDRSNRVFWMNLAQGWLPGETYTIEVAVQDAAGNYGAYGPSCSITMAGAPSLAIVNVDAALQTKATIEGVFGATASHNPFTRDFALNMVNANDTDAINVAIYDMSGKLIEASSVNPMDIESARFGANLATGMYMIQVTQGTNQAVIRQVKN